MSAASVSAVFPARLGSQIEYQCLRAQQTQPFRIQQHRRHCIDYQRIVAQHRIKLRKPNRPAAFAFAPRQAISGNRSLIPPAPAEYKTGDILRLLELLGEIALVIEAAER